ncbi:MAG: hypothetical protein ABIZ50_08420 [Solirubrobacterales bacterium]
MVLVSRRKQFIFGWGLPSVIAVWGAGDVVAVPTPLRLADGELARIAARATWPIGDGEQPLLPGRSGGNRGSLTAAAGGHECRAAEERNGENGQRQKDRRAAAG